jgi:hypothetical protein
VNLTELQEFIRSGENERLEFKKSTGQRTDAARTVCAMLNGVGGFVLSIKSSNSPSRRAYRHLNLRAIPANSLSGFILGKGR